MHASSVVRPVSDWYRGSGANVPASAASSLECCFCCEVVLHPTFLESANVKANKVLPIVFLSNYSEHDMLKQIDFFCDHAF